MPSGRSRNTRLPRVFSPVEWEFFVAGHHMGEEPAADSRHVPRPRRTFLRLIVLVVMAAASLLAWQGPGKNAAPWIASKLRPAAAARTGLVARAAKLIAAPAALSKAPAAVAGPRPAPHPATANRQRLRSR